MTAATSFSRHGGLLDDELGPLGFAPDEVLDVSVNVNPYGPCGEIATAYRNAPIHRYPDATANGARRAIGEMLDVPPQCVLVSGGAVEALWALARAVVAPGDRVLIAEPAFSEMRTAAVRAGATVVEWRASSDQNFSFDAQAFAAALARCSPRIAYIASPSNPSGRLAPVDVLVRLAERNPRTQFVVDISFLALSAAPDERVVQSSSKILWVRSLTKELAVPGVRVGFSVGPAALVASMIEQTPPWSVGAAAQAIARIALTPSVRAFVEASRVRLLDDAVALRAQIGRLGLSVHPSDTIYTLVDLGPKIAATSLRARLLREHRVLVRDATSFGLSHHIRVAARAAPDRARLLAALEKESTK